MGPQPCTFCNTLVESTPDQMLHGLPFGCAPVCIDRRIPEGVMLYGPPICWGCRGVVILGLPKEGDEGHPDRG